MMDSENTFVLILGALLVGLTLLAIVGRPHWGIALTVATLPLFGSLPSVPLATSLASVCGGASMLGYVIQRLRPDSRRMDSRFTIVHLFGILFILWFVLTHPAEALVSANRSWFWTYVQLWALAWLAGAVLRSSRSQLTVMWVFAAGALVSAVLMTQQTTFGSGLSGTVRGEGLSEGPNAAARHFVVALVFLSCVRVTARGRLRRWMILLGASILAVGLIYTVSRTGLLLLACALLMLMLFRRSGAEKKKLGLVLALGISLVFIPAQVYTIAQSHILSSVENGTDTVGIRYALWQAGLMMWWDHPIAGVGMGQFKEELSAYGRGLLRADRLGLGAHNMYIQVLAETGIIGFSLFIAMLAAAVHSLWRASRSPDTTQASLAGTWLIALLLLLLGGITKHDHYDKLLWINLGVSACFPLAGTATRLLACRDTPTEALAHTAGTPDRARLAG